MIQVDLPVAFGVGSLLARAAERQLLARDPGPLAKAMTKVIVFHSLAFMWPPLFLLVFYFGFETSHMWWHADSVIAYPWLLPAFFLALFGVNLAGFAVGARFVRAGRPQLAVILYLVMVVFCLAWIFLQPDRTMTIGTYADWQRGTAPAGSTDPFFMKFVVGLIVGYSAGLWLVFRSISRDGARLTITSSVQ